VKARYVLKIGPAGRNSDYAKEVTVIAENYDEAQTKAVVLRGSTFRNSNIWLVRFDEIDENEELLAKLAKLIKEANNGEELSD